MTNKHKNKKPIIGIIGGKGRMGSWFVKFFRQQGYTVLVADLKTKLTNTELAAKSDVVIFSVPISKTVKTIKQVIPYIKPHSLLTDLTSVKTEAVKAMLLAPQNIEVIGMHNLFGPNVDDLKNQTIVLCPARGKKWLPWLSKVFIKANAKIKITTPEKHDQLMGIVQGLTHFTAISLGLSLQKMNVNIKEILDFASPVYRLRLAETGRILAQNPEVYANISTINPYSKIFIKNYIETSKQFLKIIQNKDDQQFIKLFNQASKYFGSFNKQALMETNFLIKKLNEFKK